MQYNAHRRPTNQKATVQEAAKILHITPEAVRQRLKRGTLAKEKAPDGTVYVLLDADQDRYNGVGTNDATTDLTFMQAHLDSLLDQIEHLRRELEIRNDDLRRKDTILAQMNQTLTVMAQRIPELEGASEPRGSLERTSEEESEGEEEEAPPETQQRRPWWRRIFE